MTTHSMFKNSQVPGSPARRRVFLSGFLANISMAWKMGLMAFVLFLGILGITISAYSGMQSLRYQLSNIYDFMLIPIVAINQADTALADTQYHLEQLHNKESTASEQAKALEDIQSNETLAADVMTRYDTEWVTTASPEFTQALQDAGKLDLQGQEVAALESFHSSFDVYRATTTRYLATVQTGNPDENLGHEAIENLLIARTDLQTLINVNNQFADFSNAEAQTAFRKALLNGAVVLSIGLALGLFISYLIVVSITGRLGDLTRSASAMQEGDLDQTVAVAGRDEVSLLGATFNKMATQLKELFTTLEQRVADRTKALATSTEVSRRLSTILDQKQLVTEVVEQVKNAFNYYHAHIYLYNEAGDELLMAGGTGEAGEMMLAQVHKVAKGRGLVGRAAESNQAVLVSDTSQDPEWLPNKLLPETKSEVAVPISIGDQVLGVLDVQHNITNGLKQEDADLLKSIANQVAVALQNIQSTEIVAKRATELQTVATISTATATIRNAQEMLATVVHLTQRKFGLYHAHVFTYNEDAAILKIAACGWKEGDEHEGTHGTAQIPIAQEQSLVARSARTRQAVIVNDVHNEPGWLPNPLLRDTASELAVPLIVGDQLLGVLDAQSDRLNAFTQEDADILTTLASQVATALQNASSYAQAQRQAERETTLNAISQKIQNTSSVEAALQIAARELGRALGMRQTLVALDPSALSSNKTDDDRLSQN